MFSFASLFSLSAISLERAFALVWPLRHRVTSTKVYIYSIVLVWISGISVGASLLLAAYGILDMKHWNTSLCIVALLALLIICFSYLAIRKRQGSSHRYASLQAEWVTTKHKTLMYFVYCSSCLTCILAPEHYYLYFVLSKVISRPHIAWLQWRPILLGQLGSQSYHLQL